jgi:hypothetical protein
MTPDSSRDDAGPLDAAEQDPSAEADLGAGPARTDPEPGQDAETEGADDIPQAPAGPGATPADPDQPLNPA